MSEELLRESEAGSRTPPRLRQAALKLVLIAKKNPKAVVVEELPLVERHEQRIFSVARRITGAREDAEDVVQQTFQRAFTHLRGFEERSSFSTWLTRISVNEALQLLRKRRGLCETFVVLEVPDSGPDPEVIYSQREREKILSSSLDKLSHQTRRAIQLRELDERSTAETARIMGISVGAVKARVFHGRRRFRQKLQRHVGSAWMPGRTLPR